MSGTSGAQQRRVTGQQIDASAATAVALRIRAEGSILHCVSGPRQAQLLDVAKPCIDAPELNPAGEFPN